MMSEINENLKFFRDEVARRLDENSQRIDEVEQELKNLKDDVDRLKKAIIVAANMMDWLRYSIFAGLEAVTTLLTSDLKGAISTLISVSKKGWELKLISNDDLKSLAEHFIDLMAKGGMRFEDAIDILVRGLGLDMARRINLENKIAEVYGTKALMMWKKALEKG